MPAPREVSLACVRKLKPNKRNARTHSKKQVQEVVELIRRFGWTYPILIDEDGYIIAGHARYQAAQYLRWRRVPVIVMTGLNDAAKRAFALADNKVAENAGWDRAVLAAELGDLAVDLPKLDISIDITGFTPAEIDGLMGDLGDPEQDPVDELPNLEKVPISRLGDQWHLGNHRLRCGDATTAHDVQNLMGSSLATTVFTDPPYNVAIASIQGRGRIKHREFATASGEMSPEQFTAFLRSWLSLVVRYSVKGSIHYIFMDWRHLQEILSAGADAYGSPKNLIVWVKTNAGQGSFYRSQHELILVFKNGDSPHINNFELGQHGRHRSNVWTYAGVNTFRSGRLADLSIHPTVKPVALVADALRDCSRRGDIVLDPFMGSGTTILAAERVGRRAFGIEIDPLYVDSAIRRWQAYTKREAILSSTGQTFDEVAHERTGQSTTQVRMPRRTK